MSFYEVMQILLIIWVTKLIHVKKTKTPFLDLNIKVIGNGIKTSVYDKCAYFGFPDVTFPWLSDDVPRLPFYGIYIQNLICVARCCTSVQFSIQKIYKSLLNCCQMVIDIKSFVKHWWIFSDPPLIFYQNSVPC